MKRRVSVTLNSVWEDLLFCMCAMFTENTLRALVLVTLPFIQSLRKEPPSDILKHTRELPSQGKALLHVFTSSSSRFTAILFSVLCTFWLICTASLQEKGSVIIIVIIVSGCVVVVLGALLLYSQRKSSTGKLTCFYK